MLVEIELLPWAWPHGIPSMPKNLKKVQIYPNLLITLLELNSLTLNNLHYIMLALCKAARPAQIKEKNRNFGAVIRLFVSYLFGIKDKGARLLGWPTFPIQYSVPSPISMLQRVKLICSSLVQTSFKYKLTQSCCHTRERQTKKMLLK